MTGRWPPTGGLAEITGDPVAGLQNETLARPSQTAQPQKGRRGLRSSRVRSGCITGKSERVIRNQPIGKSTIRKVKGLTMRLMAAEGKTSQLPAKTYD